MKKSTMRKVLAIALVAAMCVAFLPMAKTTANAASLADKNYVLDAATTDATSFTVDSSGKLTADATVGTDGFFTFCSKGTKNLFKTGIDEVATDMGGYTQAFQCGGGLKNNGQAGIKIVIEEPAKVTAYVAVKAANATKHHFQYAKEGGDVVTYYEMANDPKVSQKIELTLEEAGTYYIGGNNGGNFFYVEVERLKDSKSFSANDLDTSVFNADGKLETADTVFAEFLSATKTGKKIRYYELGGEGQKPAVEANGVTYNKVLVTDGKANVSKEQATLKFTIDKKMRLSVLVASKNDSTVNVTVWDAATSAEVASVKTERKIGAGNAEVINFVLEAGTYYLGGSDNGIALYNLVLNEIVEYEMNANELEAAVDSKYEADTPIGDANYFTAIGVDKKIVVKATDVTYEGVAYSKMLQFSGDSKLNTGRNCLKINVTETAKITIIAAAKGDSGVATEIGIAKLGDSAITPVGKLAGVDEIVKVSKTNVKPGEYYIAAKKGANIFSVLVEYDPLEEKQVPWEDVATPVIGTVTVDEAGNFIVPFTAVIDKLNGAEQVAITMYQDGTEIATKYVVTQEDSVTMAPFKSGNYTFKATAIRTGAPYKVSEEVAYNDYVLNLKTPVVIASNNRGGGKYYIDWIKVDNADKYVISYKLKDSTGDYTVIDNITDGHYELSGLTEGTYEVKIQAVRTADNFNSHYTFYPDVTAQADRQWYAAVVGSAQQSETEVTDKDGNKTTYPLIITDETVDKVGILPAIDVTNTTGSVMIPYNSTGKLSDSEDGFRYYFTHIDPNTENFKLTATFEVLNNTGKDNQTGFGIIAADMAGINYYGTPDYYHKLFNSVQVVSYRGAATLKQVTGYVSQDTSDGSNANRTEYTKPFNDTGYTFDVGTKVTFSLEKTNEKFIATCNGQTIELDDTSILSVQEDGSLTIGVMATRFCAVNITDIKFETSESTGVTGGGKVDKLTPSDKIYSTSQSGREDYTLIHAANTEGTLVVKLTGKEIFNKLVAANAVSRVPATLTEYENLFTTEFTPSGTLDTLTSVDTRKGELTVYFKQYGAEGDTIVVSPDALPTGTGTMEDPVSLNMAVQYARPGQTILLKDGTYTNGVTLPRSSGGNAEKMVTIIPETVGGVVFDGTGIVVEGEYWHIYGIEVKDAPGNGIKISGNYNILEMCTVHGSGNSGIQISYTQGADRAVGLYGLLWPSYNLIKNCESYDSCDAARNDADGFAAKLTCGEGNVFYGCIAHHNVDDGWDLFAKQISGEIGVVTIENCIAYNNGWLTTEELTAETKGEGNGFKLGGGNLAGGHILKNSIAFANAAKGITSNSCFDCEIYNCTSYGNSIKPGSEEYSVGLNKRTTDPMGWKVDGLISMTKDSNTKLADTVPLSLHSATNYVYNGKTSYNSLGEEAVDAWFVSTDVTIVPKRAANGTIDMGGLLELTDKAPATSGARLDITSEKALSVMPGVTTITDGTITIPETGDNSNMMFFAFLALMSVAALCVAGKKVKRA